MVLGKSYELLSLKTAVEQTSLTGLPATFQFPKNFYQPNAVVHVSAVGGTVSLSWPSGDKSALIPTARDRYIDRAYWVPVEVVRDVAGRIAGLKYDRFIGQRINS